VHYQLSRVINRGLTLQSTGRYTACQHLARHFILGQILSIRSAPVTSNVRHHTQHLGTHSTMSHDAEAFHLEEYKQIRSEVVGLLTRIESLFRYSIIASVAVFAWLLSSGMGAASATEACLKLPVSLLWVGWLIPPLFIVLCGAMAGTTMVRVVEMGSYLHRLERFLGKRWLGWQHSLYRTRSYLTPFTAIVWLMLLVAASGASYLGIQHTRMAGGICKSEPVETKRSDA
jgi:hypothetical protein